MLLGVVFGLIAAFVYININWRSTSQDVPQESGPSAESPPPASGDQITLPAGLVDRGVIPLAAPDWSQRDNPARDGWTIEVYADHAKHVLTELAEVAYLGAAANGKLAAACDAQIRVEPLLPAPLVTSFQDDVFQVERMSEPASRTTAETITESAESSTESSTGPAGPELLAARVGPLAQFWSNFGERRFEIKVFRSLPEGDGFVTHQYVAASGRSAQTSVEQHATWIVHWRMASTDAKPVIRSLEVSEFEQTTSRHPRPLFADVAPAVLGRNACFASQFLYGLNHWIDRTQDMRYFSPLGNPGLAVGDVNGDGRDDLYVCQEANLPNRLFLQQPDGTAIEAAAEWRVDWLEGSRSALLLDWDNDGDQDLCVAVMGGVVVASNEGDHFQVRDVLKTDDDTTSMSAADYDLDGDLDLYVCVDYPNDYFAENRHVPVQVGAANRIYHDANNAGRNSLFRNDGNWQFVDATEQVGLDLNNRRYSWASCWDDYDDDGDQDLYVSNDFGRNNLYTNQQGRFEDRAAAADAEDIASGMSAAWGDVNRDGRMDLYIGNMFSSAGGRITYQAGFKQDADEEIRQRLRRFARGNTLLINEGDGTFQDVSEQATVHLGRWAWSSNFVDINNDGWQDLAVANGYITSDDTGDL